jgi:hypothetical protein
MESEFEQGGDGI